MKHLGLFASLCAGIVAASLFVACGSSEDESPPGGAGGQSGLPEAKSALPRNTSPVVSADDAQALADGNAAFALDLYASPKLKPAGQNYLCSPASISIGLAMTYAGAHGATEQEMAKALHFTLPQAKLHPAFNALALELDKRNQAADPITGKGFKLSLANALWGDKAEKFVPAFLDTLSQNYGAGVNLVDFVGNAEGARISINDWVSNATLGKIKDLLAKDDITADTRLVLANAVYFNASWKHPFNESATTDGTFHAPSADVSVPMMHESLGLPYAEGTGWQAIEIPYEGDQTGMTIVLPAPGQLDAVESMLTLAWLKQLIKDETATPVDVTMPKFSFVARTPLQSALESLGMNLAFSPNADFSGMSPHALMIGDVIHQAFIAVDEKGTEAAAATAVTGMWVDAGPPLPPPKQFVMDRPFVFFIRDYPTQAILFAGRVVNPNAK